MKQFNLTKKELKKLILKKLALDSGSESDSEQELYEKHVVLNPKLVSNPKQVVSDEELDWLTDAADKLQLDSTTLSKVAISGIPPLDLSLRSSIPQPLLSRLRTDPRDQFTQGQSSSRGRQRKTMEEQANDWRQTQLKIEQDRNDELKLKAIQQRKQKEIEQQKNLNPSSLFKKK